MRRFIIGLFLLVVTAVPTQAKDKRGNEGARLKFEQNSYDFGTISRKGEDRECEFCFVNSGSEPLVILSAQTSCSCLKVDFSRKPIAPGQKGVVKLLVEVRKMEKGVFHRVVQIKSNSATGTEILTIKGSCEEN